MQKATHKTTKTTAPKTAPIKAKAPAPFVHAHSDAGVSGKHYTGLSGYLNSNRKPRIPVAGEHKFNRTTAQLTARSLATLTAMRNAYDLKQFGARGFDNAVCAMLISAGLIRTIDKSGAQHKLDNITYAIDGPKPLMLAVTASGRAYGNATA
jgi:hypothetical protein